MSKYKDSYGRMYPDLNSWLDRSFNDAELMPVFNTIYRLPLGTTISKWKYFIEYTKFWKWEYHPQGRLKKRDIDWKNIDQSIKEYHS